MTNQKLAHATNTIDTTTTTTDTHAVRDFTSDLTSDLTTTGSELSAYCANDDVVYAATQIFDALSDFTRFQILSALGTRERSVSELQEAAHVTQSAISHQLRLLRDRGVVVARRDGQRMMYSIADDHVVTLLRVGLEHAAEDIKSDV